MPNSQTSNSPSAKQVFNSFPAALTHVNQIAPITEDECLAPEGKLHIISISKFSSQEDRVTVCIPTLGMEERVRGDLLTIAAKAKQDFENFLSRRDIEPIDLDVRVAVRPRYFREWVFLDSDPVLPQVSVDIAVERWADAWRIMGVDSKGWKFGADYSSEIVERELLVEVRDQVLEDFYSSERRFAVLPVPNVTFWVPVVNTENEVGYFRANQGDLNEEMVDAWLTGLACDDASVTAATECISAELVEMFDEPTDIASLRKNLAALAEDVQHPAYEQAFRDHITEGVNLEDRTLMRLGVPRVKFMERV